MRIVNKVPHNEEIIDKPHPFNDGKLKRKPCARLIIRFRHFTLKPLIGKLFQILQVADPIGSGKARQMTLAECEFKLTFFRDFNARIE